MGRKVVFSAMMAAGLTQMSPATAQLQSDQGVPAQEAAEAAQAQDPAFRDLASAPPEEARPRRIDPNAARRELASRPAPAGEEASASDAVRAEQDRILGPAREQDMAAPRRATSEQVEEPIERAAAPMPAQTRAEVQARAEVQPPARVEPEQVAEPRQPRAMEPAARHPIEVAQDRYPMPRPRAGEPVTAPIPAAPPVYAEERPAPTAPVYADQRPAPRAPVYAEEEERAAEPRRTYEEAAPRQPVYAGRQADPRAAYPEEGEANRGYDDGRDAGHDDRAPREDARYAMRPDLPRDARETRWGNAGPAEESCRLDRADRLQERVRDDVRYGRIGWRVGEELQSEIDYVQDMGRSYCASGMNDWRWQRLDRQYAQIEDRLRYEYGRRGWR